MNADGEAALDRHTLEHLLSSFEADMVLVGGQALAFWMDRFGVASDDAAISSDGDVLGNLEQARRLAQALHGRLLVPTPRSRTALVAQVLVPVGDGRVRNVDIVHKLYSTGGLRKATEFTRHVIASSIEVTWGRDARFRVMDPFDMLDSRVQNAVGLVDAKGPHVVTQARWAIDVARRALLALASGDARDEARARRLGPRLQGIFTLAHSLAGRRLWTEHGIDVLVAVDVATLARMAPRCERQLAKLAQAQAKRSGAPIAAVRR